MAPLGTECLLSVSTAYHILQKMNLGLCAADRRSSLFFQEPRFLWGSGLQR